MIYDFLKKPGNIMTEIRIIEAKIEGLRQGMYPSAVRYDKDKVMSSPVDPMAAYIEEVDELERKIRVLQVQYKTALDEVERVARTLDDDLEKKVVMYRYVAQMSMRQIAFELKYTEDWMFKVRRQAVDHLAKKYPEL